MKTLPLKTQVKICVNAVWFGALLAILSRTVGKWCLWLGMAVVVVAAICRYTLIRCPHCGYKLSEGKTVPPRCPHCGEALE